MSLNYLFLDMNSYFASVEQQNHPELRGRPVAVVPVEAETTCCLAVSYEGKKHGVRTGTSIADARRLCPGITFIVGDHRHYIATHHRIVRAVEACLPIHAVRSIDEMVCRLLPREQNEPYLVDLTKRIKASIAARVGEFLKCSIGFAPNQMLAKVAADMNKPDGMTLLPSESLPESLYPLKLTDFPGIGPRMHRRFLGHNISTVRQLCQLSAAQLGQVWGSRMIGSQWWHTLRGDDLPEKPTRRRTVGHSHVLPPESRTGAGARAVLLRLVEKAAARLRSIGYWTGSVSIAIKSYNGPTWVDRVRIAASQDTLTLLQATARLWDRRPDGIPLRVGVVFTDLVPAESATPSLFDEDRGSLEVSNVMDRINRQFGVHTVHYAGSSGYRGGPRTRIAFTQIPDLLLPDG